eukprot:COSAG01_NODE_2022_length_8630_cov_16.836010_3_plen_1043_part_00
MPVASDTAVELNVYRLTVRKTLDPIIRAAHSSAGVRAAPRIERARSRLPVGMPRGVAGPDAWHDGGFRSPVMPSIPPSTMGRVRLIAYEVEPPKTTLRAAQTLLAVAACAGVAVAFAWWLASMPAACHIHDDGERAKGPLVPSSIELHTQKLLILIPAAPIFARLVLLLCSCWGLCRKRPSSPDADGLGRSLLVHGGVDGGVALSTPLSTAAMTSSPRGWLALTGAPFSSEEADAPAILQYRSTPTWGEAGAHLQLGPKTTVIVAAGRLIGWHMSQPICNLTIFWWYSCELSSLQVLVGGLVAARELVFIAGTAVAVWACPAFLLLDVGSVVQEARHKLIAVRRLLSYIVRPHVYVTLCLMNSPKPGTLGRRISSIVSLLAAIFTTVVDFASCVALGLLISEREALRVRQAADPTEQYAALQIDARTSGWGVWSSALALVYGLNSVTYLCVFGPLAAIELRRKAGCRRPSDVGEQSQRAAIEEERRRCFVGKRGRFGAMVCMGALVCGLLYAALGLLLQLGGHDVFCNGFAGSVDCGPNGRCTAGSCACRLPTNWRDDHWAGKRCEAQLPFAFRVTGSNMFLSGVYRRVAPGTGGLATNLCSGKPVYMRDGVAQYLLYQPHGMRWWALSRVRDPANFMCQQTALATGPWPAAAGHWRECGLNCTAEAISQNLLPSSALGIVALSCDGATDPCCGIECGEHGICVPPAGICACSDSFNGTRCQWAPVYNLTGALYSDYEGLYTRTNHTCSGAPVYEHGQGSIGISLFRYPYSPYDVMGHPIGASKAQSWVTYVWQIGLTTKGTGSHECNTYHTTHSVGVCPDSPDGPACRGGWEGYLDVFGDNDWRKVSTIAWHAVPCDNGDQCCGVDCGPYGSCNSADGACLCHRGYSGPRCMMAHAYNITGAQDAFINGVYTRVTPDEMRNPHYGHWDFTCHDKPVYQCRDCKNTQAPKGLVLYQPNGARDWFVHAMPFDRRNRGLWPISGFNYSTLCEAQAGFLCSSNNGGVCFHEPGGKDCRRRWQENEPNLAWVNEPSVSVAAISAAQ